MISIDNMGSGMKGIGFAGKVDEINK